MREERVKVISTITVIFGWRALVLESQWALWCECDTTISRTTLKTAERNSANPRYYAILAALHPTVNARDEEKGRRADILVKLHELLDQVLEAVVPTHPVKLSRVEFKVVSFKDELEGKSCNSKLYLG